MLDQKNDQKQAGQRHDDLPPDGIAERVFKKIHSRFLNVPGLIPLKITVVCPDYQARSDYRGKSKKEMAYFINSIPDLAI